MKIEIIAAESLGVRGLCCCVRAAGKTILIDPGVALGYRRHGLLPHPFQVAVGRQVRQRIVACWETATDLVISHFHGDHVPLPDANPYQLSLAHVAGLNPQARIWAGPQEALTTKERKRAASLSAALHGLVQHESTDGEKMTFSEPLPHGDPDGPETVMLTRIEAESVFVHGSDIQLLNETAVSQILAWKPDIVLVGGPPLYLGRLSEPQRRQAWQHAVLLAQGVGTLILDHHLMRSRQGAAWLEELSRETGRQVLCAADFMQRPRMLLEACRARLYEDMPVPSSWHEHYAANGQGAEEYLVQGATRYCQCGVQ